MHSSFATTFLVQQISALATTKSYQQLPSDRPRSQVVKCDLPHCTPPHTTTSILFPYIFQLYSRRVVESEQYCCGFQRLVVVGELVAAFAFIQFGFDFGIHRVSILMCLYVCTCKNLWIHVRLYKASLYVCLCAFNTIQSRSDEFS